MGWVGLDWVCVLGGLLFCVDQGVHEFFVSDFDEGRCCGPELFECVFRDGVMPE